MKRIPFLLEEGEEQISFITRTYEFLRRRISINKLLILFFILSFTFSIYFFAKFEYVENPARATAIAEGKNPLFESVYWLVTTMTTVGYGDLTPITTDGKLIAMFMMILGVGLLGFLMSQIMQSIVSTNLGNLFGVNRTRKNIDYIICGWNKVSEAALKDIEGTGKSIVIIDKKSYPELAKRADIHFVLGDATDKRVLEKANIKKAKNILLVLGDDSQVLLAIHVIRSLNPWINMIAKIEYNEHIQLAEDAGADQIVSPSALGGRLLSIADEEPATVRWVLNAIQSAKGLSLVEYYVSEYSPWVNKKLGDVQKKFEGKARVLGVDTAHGLERVPDKARELKVGNKLILMVNKEKFHEFLKNGNLVVKV